MRPFESTVITGIALPLPKLPALTPLFASVRLSATLAVPSKLTAGAVASPVALKFLAVCNAVAVPALPEIVVGVVLAIVKLLATSL